ncbi:MAG: DUF5947 family protein [Acidobacteriota bacterium]|nr:DUF5947 family protein [Acidobacteriota bacterium]
MSSSPPQQNNSFATLRRFVRQRAPVERCELCSAELGVEHQHLIEPTSRQMVCACDPCAILFSGGAEMKYRRVPRRVRYLPEFELTDAQWDSLAIPIQMAFFFHSTPAGKVIVLYPGPAGATESLLDLESWDDIVRKNAILKTMEPDVEALLVNRVGSTRDYYVVPVDECYKLVGLIRTHWRGLSGGTEVWRELKGFFDKLKAVSSPTKEATSSA